MQSRLLSVKCCLDGELLNRRRNIILAIQLSHPAAAIILSYFLLLFGKRVIGGFIMKEKTFNKNNLFKIILTSILIAMDIILERFLAYSVWNNTVSFGFVTVAFAACYLGVPYAMTVAGLGDLIGAILKPFGPYFVGFTVTNLLMGLILGLFLSKNINILKIGLAIITSKIVCSLVLNTIWISILYRNGIDAFWTVLVTRLPFNAVMAVIEILVISILFSKKSHINHLIKKL